MYFSLTSPLLMRSVATDLDLPVSFLWDARHTCKWVSESSSFFFCISAGCKMHIQILEKVW